MKINAISYACLSLLILALSADSTAAQGVTREDTETRAKTRFAEMDQDKDGFLTDAEFKQQLEDLFTRADKNGDGVLERREMRGFRAAAAAAGAAPAGAALTRDEVATFAASRSSHFDTDGDGRISEAEFIDGRLRDFDKADADGDGRVTVRELRNARNR